MLKACLGWTLLSIAHASNVPHAIVVNVPAKTERLASAQAELERAKVDYEVLAAVDGRRMSEEERKAKCTKLARWFLTPGVSKSRDCSAWIRWKCGGGHGLVRRVDGWRGRRRVAAGVGWCQWDRA